MSSGEHSHNDLQLDITRSEADIAGLRITVADLQKRVEALEAPQTPPSIPDDVWVLLYDDADPEDDYVGEQSSMPHSLEVVDAPGKPGRKAMRHLLLPDDPQWKGNIGYRAEIHGEHMSEGEEVSIGRSFLIPSDYNTGHNSTWDDRIIMQWADEGSPMWSIHLNASRQSLELRQKAFSGSSFEYHRGIPFATDVWYNIATHHVWSFGDSGVFELFLNGKREYLYLGRTLAVRSTTYDKWGIYGQPTKLYFGEHRRAFGPDMLQHVMTQW